MKIAAVVVGLFVAGLAYLSYKGWIDVKWVEMENATRTTLTNIAGQAVNALLRSALQFATHSSTIATSGLPTAAGLGFVPGTNGRLQEGIRNKDVRVTFDLGIVILPIHRSEDSANN